MSRAVYAAIEAFLEAQGLTVYDTDASRTTVPQGYVVVYMDSGRRRSQRAALNARNARFDVMVRSVADDPFQYRWIVERVLRLVDHRLAVPGWDCHPIEHMYSNPPGYDTDLPERIADGVDGFAFNATRLSE